MKRSTLVPALLLLSLRFSSLAQSLPEAEQLIQSRDYLPAAEKLAALPVEARADGYADWLRAVALHQAGKPAEAVSAAGAVPAGSTWYRKALLLKARALTDLKKFTEAESLYAEAAARALVPALGPGARVKGLLSSNHSQLPSNGKGLQHRPLNSQLSTLNSQLSILNSQLSTLNSQLPLNAQTMISRRTFPCTSVRRRSRPLKR